MSDRTISRILRDADLQPHRQRMWLTSQDDEFRTKRDDVLRVYYESPRKEHIVCVDEKTGMQALPRGDGQAALAVRQALPTSSLLASGLAEAITPNILSLAHWQRLEQGALYAETSRIDWVSLLRRTFEIDLRICTRCGGRLSVRSVITEPDAIERVLAPLRRSRDPPAAA